MKILLKKSIAVILALILIPIISTADTTAINKKVSTLFFGEASWYGGRFQGRKTANGEIFDTYKMTAAHKTLPFGTIVKVTNLKNDKSVKVRINDRGPFIKNRIIDLSFAAAKNIKMLKDGTAKVEVRILKLGDGNYIKPFKNLINKKKITSSKKTLINKKITSKKPVNKKTIVNKTKPSIVYEDHKPGYFAIQLGAFKTKKYADELMKKLKSKNFHSFVRKIPKDKYFKVRVGSFKDRSSAEEVFKNLSFTKFAISHKVIFTFVS